MKVAVFIQNRQSCELEIVYKKVIYFNYVYKSISKTKPVLDYSCIQLKNKIKKKAYW